ncbi:MAG: phosphate ABC transporter substrate-binding protein [Verrucomicrobiales bacterium]|nr:phosphate ABC transporter substrate-binding protein [Verrucomicrobiales bacterium]
MRAEVNGGLGETVANGLADHLQAAFARKEKRPDKTTTRPFLVAFAGQGGRQIQELSPADLSTDPRTPESRRHGGGYYRTSLDDARRAVVVAEKLGMKFRVEALYWMQGEGNGGPTGGIVPTRWDAEIPRPAGLEWYRDQLITYRKQWSADLAAITGQTGEIPMFTYQTLGPAGEAQLLAADADEAIHLVGPHYAVPSALNSRRPDGRAGDAIHLSADGERWWGEQVGKVMHRVLHRGDKWEPLRPQRARLDETRTSVLIDFLVPRPPLVIDTTFLPRQEMAVKDGFSSLAGFQVRDRSGATVTLLDLVVDGPERVRIRLAKALSAGERWTVSYGHPATFALGTIAAIRPGPEIDGRVSEEIILTNDHSGMLRPLLDEGAFFVTGTSDAKPLRAAIREVAVENGVTVLRYDPVTLRDGLPFAQGLAITAQRSFSYGNLRDSDPEPAVFTFADTRYGTRAGQPYPLWNWCILFSNLPGEL